MVSKRDLGISYFLGLGLGLIASLLGYFLLTGRSTDVISVGTLTAVGFAGSLPFLGYWLRQSDLSDTAVWAVAQWCTVGVAVPTLFVGALMFFDVRLAFVLRFPHLLVNLVAAGGVVGGGLGLILELRNQYARVDELNRRNRVLNQIMRHDIRNDVTVIEGRLELIAEQAENVDEGLLGPVQRKSEDIVEISRLAEDIQRLDEDTDRKPVDVVAVVSDCVASVRDSYPEVEITTSYPDEAWAATGPLLRTVVDNLVENAIEHNDHTPRLTIDIETTDGIVLIRVGDNGPGIPETHRQTLTSDTTPSSPAGSELGLWLVTWFVDRYDGSIRVEENAQRGTTVTVELPAASRPEPAGPHGPRSSPAD